MSPVIDADAKALDQFPTQPRGYQRNQDSDQRKHDGKSWRLAPIAEANKPADEKQCNHHKVSTTMPQPNRFGPSAAWNRKPVEESENRRQQGTDDPGGDVPKAISEKTELFVISRTMSKKNEVARSPSGKTINVG